MTANELHPSTYMKKILIASYYFDYHAAAIKWGLEHSGAKVDYWCISDFTELQSISAFPSASDGSTFKIHGNEISIPVLNYDAFWLRRGISPVIPSSVDDKD